MDDRIKEDEELLQYLEGVKHGYIVAITKFCNCLTSYDGNFTETISIYVQTIAEKIADCESSIRSQRRMIHQQKGGN